MQKVKQFVKQNRKSAYLFSSDYDILVSSQRGSVVEQRFRKPPVVGSTPTAGSSLIL